MSKIDSKIEAPKNNDHKINPVEEIHTFFAYVEAGFKGEWKLFNDLKAALNEVSYNELYVAYKINEETVKELSNKYKKTGTN